MTTIVNANFIEDVGESRHVYSHTTMIGQRSRVWHGYMDHAGLNLIEPWLGPQSLWYT